MLLRRTPTLIAYPLVYHNNHMLLISIILSKELVQLLIILLLRYNTGLAVV